MFQETHYTMSLYALLLASFPISTLQLFFFAKCAERKQTTCSVETGSDASNRPVQWRLGAMLAIDLFSLGGKNRH